MALIKTPAPGGARTVLCVTTALGGGGAESHLLRLVNYLDRDRYRPVLAVSRAGGSYESLVAEDVPLVHLTGSRLPESSTLHLAASIRPLRRLMAQLRPDLVFSVLDIVSLVTLRSVRKLSDPPPVVVSVQNSPRLSRATSRNPVTGWVLREIPRRFPKARAAIAISGGVAQDLQELVPGLAGRIEPIHNAGVDDRTKKAASEPLPDGAQRPVGPLMVACGRLVEQKAYPDMLRAMCRIRKVRPGAELWILGVGPARARLEQLVKELKLGSAVRFFGFQTNPLAFMAAADVFLLSSRWEGFGNVVVEAMSVGTPVVATATEGPQEIIDSGRNGLLVPIADEVAMAEAVGRLLESPAYARRLGAAGVERSHDFHAATVAEHHAELWDRVLEDY